MDDSADDDTGILVKAAAIGDAAAWQALYQRYSGLVWAVARAYLVNRSDAQDVCQTIWLRLAENLSRLREPEKVGAWLARSTRREALLVLRTSRRTTPVATLEITDLGFVADTPESLILEAEAAAARTDRAEIVWNAFAELGEQCRQLLRLVIATPRPSYQEIADGLGLAIGSIGPIRARCLRRLGALLAERGITTISDSG